MSLGHRWCLCRGVITRDTFRNQKICQLCGKEIFLYPLRQDFRNLQISRNLQNFARRSTLEEQGGSTSVACRSEGESGYFRSHKRKVDRWSPGEGQGDEKYRRRSNSFDSGLQKLQETFQIGNGNRNFLRRASSEVSVVSSYRRGSEEG